MQLGPTVWKAAAGFNSDSVSYGEELEPEFQFSSSFNF